VRRVVVDHLLFRFSLCRSIPDLFALNFEICQKSRRNLDVFVLPKFVGAPLPKVVRTHMIFRPLTNEFSFLQGVDQQSHTGPINYCHYFLSWPCCRIKLSEWWSWLHVVVWSTSEVIYSRNTGLGLYSLSLTNQLGDLAVFCGGTAAAAPPPFRPGKPAPCGSRPLVTPYYCRLGDLLCYTCMLYLSTILCVYAYVICVFFVLWVFFTASSFSTLILLVGSFTCKTRLRLPYNLYCVGGDVKHCSIQSTDLRSGE